MRTHGEVPEANENGVTSFKEGMTFDLAMVEGRDKETSLDVLHRLATIPSKNSAKTGKGSCNQSMAT